MSEDEPGIWYRWTPENAESPVFADVAGAVAEFESLDSPPGQAATAWLKEKALLEHPSTVTYVFMRHGRAEGFFALVSSNVELTQSHRKLLLPKREGYLPKPTQGASLAAWLAKHRESKMSGEVLVDFAISIAMAVAGRQGTVAFVLDPYDEETEKLWTGRYGFRRSRTEIRDRRRLWVPLEVEGVTE